MFTYILKDNLQKILLKPLIIVFTKYTSLYQFLPVVAPSMFH